MTPQLDKFLKALRDLPYQDKMKVAKFMESRTNQQAVRLAEALSEAPDELVEDCITQTQEESVLREALGNRKRSILIYRMGSGWRAELASVGAALGASQTHARELRMALNQMLDQLAAGYVMLK